MPDKKFLEEYPLYRKFPFKHSSRWLSDQPKPPIHMQCPKCNSEQTFRMMNEYSKSHEDALGMIVRVTYRCTACLAYEREFLLLFDQIDSDHQFVIKVGQYPSWEISPDKNLSKMMGDHVEFYKRGLVCESQSYGIGAVAYYRRIVEEVIDDLLDSIEELILDQEKKKYREALEKTKLTKVTDEKIKLVKDLLPPILRPDGLNPLSIIYEALSAGLHDQSEDECMEIAEKIRGSLVFLVNQVLASKGQSKEFTESMRKILEKK